MNIFQKESIYDKMLIYMEDKYGEKFTFIEREGTNIVRGSSKRNANFSSDKFPGEKITVSGDVGDDDKYHFYDNYYAYLLSDEINKFAYDLVSPIYGQCKVFFDSRTCVAYDNNMGKNSTIREYFDAQGLSLFIFVDPSADISKKDENIEKLGQKLKENKIQSRIIIEYLNQNISEVDPNNFRSYIYGNNLSPEEDNRIKTVGIFKMNISFEFSSKEWR